MPKLIPPRLCVICREPFTPKRSTSKDHVGGMTICCNRTCGHKYAGRKSVENGTHAKAVAARVRNAGLRILKHVEGLTPVQAYRVGLRRGYTRGYAQLPMWMDEDGTVTTYGAGRADGNRIGSAVAVAPANK